MNRDTSILYFTNVIHEVFSPAPKAENSQVLQNRVIKTQGTGIMKRLFLICIVETAFVPAATAQSSTKKDLFLPEFVVHKRHDVSPFVLKISALLIMTAKSLILPKHPYCNHAVRKT
jgi:hypothetical protein